MKIKLKDQLKDAAQTVLDQATIIVRLKSQVSDLESKLKVTDQLARDRCDGLIAREDKLSSAIKRLEAAKASAVYVNRQRGLSHEIALSLLLAVEEVITSLR